LKKNIPVDTSIANGIRNNENKVENSEDVVGKSVGGNSILSAA
jgi:hypothetical protein